MQLYGGIFLLPLIKLEPWNCGNYALLSDIYASAGRWDKSVMTRKMMRDISAPKMPFGVSFRWVRELTNSLQETHHTLSLIVYMESYSTWTSRWKLLIICWTNSVSFLILMDDWINSYCLVMTDVGLALMEWAAFLLKWLQFPLMSSVFSIQNIN